LGKGRQFPLLGSYDYDCLFDLTKSIAELLAVAFGPSTQEEHEPQRKRCQNQFAGVSVMLFVSATSSFEFAHPQLDSGGDFPRTLMAGLFQLVEFRLFRRLSFVFDNSDLLIHEL
jgi:hypothetical protein